MKLFPAGGVGRAASSTLAHSEGQQSVLWGAGAAGDGSDSGERTNEHLDRVLRTQPWVCGTAGLVHPQVWCVGCLGPLVWVWTGPVQCLHRELLSVRTHLTQDIRPLLSSPPLQWHEHPVWGNQSCGICHSSLSLQLCAPLAPYTSCPLLSTSCCLSVHAQVPVLAAEQAAVERCGCSPLVLLIQGCAMVGGPEGKLVPVGLLEPLNPVPWGERSGLGKGPALQSAGLRGSVRKVRIAPPALGITGDLVVCAMCVPDANLPLFISCFISLSPMPCSSLSFLVKLEQLDLGGNDLEVLVGEGWWGGVWVVGRGRSCTSVQATGFPPEMQRARPSGYLGRF